MLQVRGTLLRPALLPTNQWSGIMSTAREVVLSLVSDIRPLVSRIEADPMPTTRDHYGDYMHLLTVMNDGLCNPSLCVAVVLAAGGNNAGVKAAAQIHGW